MFLKLVLFVVGCALFLAARTHSDQWLGIGLVVLAVVMDWYNKSQRQATPQPRRVGPPPLPPRR